MDPYPPQPPASHTRFASLEAYLDKGFTTIFGDGVRALRLPLRRERAQLLPIRRQQAPDGHVQYHLGTFRHPYDLCYLAWPTAARRPSLGRPADPNEFLARWVRKHFSGDTSALGDVVEAVGELRSATAASTLGRMEYFDSLHLMNRIAMAPWRWLRCGGSNPRPTSAADIAQAGNRFPTGRPDSPVAEGDQRNCHGPRDGDFASTKSPLKVLEAGVKAIPAMIQAERKWWNRDRYQEHESRVETFVRSGRRWPIRRPRQGRLSGRRRLRTCCRRRCNCG